MSGSYLELIIGPMFSGKTSRLVEIYNQYTYCDVPTLVINHSIDDRFGKMLTTHSLYTIPCVSSTLLNDVYVRDNIKVILINEGQFFTDLIDWVTKQLDKDIRIYICGLDGDFERKKFGQILDLIPLCDKVTKLSSLCAICKNITPGIFSKRLTNELSQTLVGASNYIPVCRKCY